MGATGYASTKYIMRPCALLDNSEQELRRFQTGNGAVKELVEKKISAMTSLKGRRVGS